MTDTAAGSAASMGTRAGERLRETGIPTPNPFKNRPVLAAAWRRAYLSATTAGRHR